MSAPREPDEQQVSFFGSRGTRLAGVLRLPDQSGKNHPAVVLCQGLSGVKHLVLPGIADAFAARGIATLRFDYAGYGESDGERGWIDPRARADDALCAFAWLTAQGGIDAQRLGVYGHSYGGPVAIAMASRDRRVRAVVSVSGPGDGRALLRSVRSSWDWVAFKKAIEAERTKAAVSGSSTVVDVGTIFPFSPAFLEAYRALETAQGGTSAMAEAPTDSDAALGTHTFHLASVDAMLDFHPEDAAARLGPRPLLLVHGEDDDTAALEEVEAIHRNHPGPKRWEIVPGAAHNDLDAGPGLDQVIAWSAAWFDEHLAAR